VRYNPLSTYSYGSLFANQTFNYFVILADRPNNGRTASDGLVIAASATTVKQAIRLSDALVNADMKKYRLK